MTRVFAFSCWFPWSALVVGVGAAVDALATGAVDVGICAGFLIGTAWAEIGLQRGQRGAD